MERTLILCKPDAVQRGLIGEILSRFERKGLKIVGLKMIRLSRELAETHYAEHVGKPFYAFLMEFITSSPSVALVVEGQDAIARTRTIVGATLPSESSPGTIRGDYANHVTLNLIHASDGPESAEKELALFFEENELFGYKRCDEKWLGVWE